MKCELKLDPSLGEPRGGGKGNPIMVDSHQIQQVLMNLVLNAIAASTERQPIIIWTKNRANAVECSVQDFGKGISTSAHKRLFEPFFTTKKDGVGLGLYLSRILVEENHGGSIDIRDAAPGKGATFVVQLPKSN